MWSTIGSVLVGLLGKLLGGLFGKKDPSAVDLADSNARAQERLRQQEEANEISTKAAAARAAAADRGMREFPDAGASEIVTGPDKPRIDDSNLPYRD